MQLVSKRLLVSSMVVLCCGVVAAQRVPKGEIGNQRLSSEQSGTKIEQLLGRRVSLLRQMESLYVAQYRAGQTSLDDVEQAEVAVYRTDLQRKHARAEQIAIAQQWVNSVSNVQKLTEARSRAGLVTQAETIKAQAAVVEAEIVLERAKDGSLRL